MVDELEQLEVALKKQMAAATTPPPVTEEGEATPAPAEAELIQAKASPAAQFDALLQIHHSTAPKGDGMERIQRAMSKMIMSVWVDPESKRNLAKLAKNGALLQAEAGQEPEEEAAAPEEAASGGHMEEN